MSESLSRTVAAKVAHLLAERGMSGHALARATGIPRASVTRKLAGASAFTLDELPAIADAVSVEVSHLLGSA